jgi:DNA primase
VSTPVAWSEVEAALDAGDASRLEFEIDAVLARAAELGDLYAPSLGPPQELPTLG